MRRRVRLAVVAAVLLCTCGASGLAGVVSVHLDFEQAAGLEPVRAAQAQSAARRAVGRITIPGFNSLTSGGNPALPCKLIYIALPPTADEGSVKVLPGSCRSRVLAGAYDVTPVPPMIAADCVLSWGEGKNIVGGRNTLVYETDEFYPRDHLKLVGVGRLRTWKVAAFEFWPYAYNPVTGRVRVASPGATAVGFSSEPSPAEEPADPAARAMSGFVANRDQALQWYPAPPASPATVGYVIVTTAAIARSSTMLAAFADFQSQRGYAVRIATEDDWGGGVGDVAAGNIRRWLADHYISLGIEYVLLVGNPNPVSGDVPMKMLWPRNKETSYKEAPSDYYYADLTGNWDLDGDGFAGEEPDDFGPGGIDRIPEVYVGRIPYYGSIADLDHILRKTIEYQSTSLGSWSRRFLLPMKPLDVFTPSYQLGEAIRRDIALPLGFDPVRVYDGAYGLVPPPERLPCEFATVRQEWGSGAGVVLWMSHGSSNSATGVITSTQCDGLDDSRPSIVYQGSCSTGRPEDTANLGYSLLRRGAVATVSASRVSWYYVGEVDFTNTDSIGGLGYLYSLELLGARESCARAFMAARISAPMYVWPNHLVFNLYGDPSLALDRPVGGSVVGKVLSLDGFPVPDAVIRTADGSRIAQSGPDGSYCLGGGWTRHTVTSACPPNASTLSVSTVSRLRAAARPVSISGCHSLSLATSRAVLKTSTGRRSTTRRSPLSRTASQLIRTTMAVTHFQA